MSRPTLAWIASYPKSGNTWMRLFLANYLVGGQAPLPINQVHRFICFDAAARIYESAGLPSFDPVEQPDAAWTGRLKMLGWIASRADLTFVKTHMPRSASHGQQLIPDDLTRAALYITRDPRDVVVSYSRHFGTTLAGAAAAIGDADNVVRPNANSVAQPIGDWSGHAASWTREVAAPKALWIRYEDMLARPRETFARTIRHFGLPLDESRLRRAIAFSSFDELQRQEARSGFREHPTLRQPFFHTGAVGQWARLLPTDAARRIETEHAEQMARFGYLSAG